jgi:hypothetical protein
MRAHNSLNGFDILVSYNENEINALLRARAEMIAASMELAPFKATYNGMLETIKPRGSGV